MLWKSGERDLRDEENFVQPTTWMHVFAHCEMVASVRRSTAPLQPMAFKCAPSLAQILKSSKATCSSLTPNCFSIARAAASMAGGPQT